MPSVVMPSVVISSSATLPRKPSLVKDVPSPPSLPSSIVKSSILRSFVQLSFERGPPEVRHEITVSSGDMLDRSESLSRMRLSAVTSLRALSSPRSFVVSSLSASSPELTASSTSMPISSSSSTSTSASSTSGADASLSSSTSSLQIILSNSGVPQCGQMNALSGSGSPHSGQFMGLQSSGAT